MFARTTLPLMLLWLSACHPGDVASGGHGRARGLGDSGPLSMGERSELACYADASAKACFDAGKHFQIPDAARAKLLYRRGCDLGQLDSCTAVAFLDERNGQVEEALDLYMTACQRGEPIACGNLGRAMDTRGWDHDKAQQLIAQAEHQQEERCAAGDAYQCWELATDLDDMAKTDQSVAAKRLALLDKSCALDSWLGCWELGDTLLDDTSSPIERSRGRQVLDKMCEQGHGNSCERVGEVLDKSHQPEAAAYFSKACGYGNKAGCFLDCDRLRTASKLEQARTQCRRGCMLGDDAACATYGVMLDNGQGGPADVFRAAAVLERACDLGKASACRNWGIMVEAGRGVKQDPNQAQEIYDRACQQQDSEACERGDALRDSTGQSPDDDSDDDSMDDDD
jgi:TPR repeat protein